MRRMHAIRYTQLAAVLLEDVQLGAAHAVTGATRCTSHTLLYNETTWEILSKRREEHTFKTVLQDN